MKMSFLSSYIKYFLGIKFYASSFFFILWRLIALFLTINVEMLAVSTNFTPLKTKCLCLCFHDFMIFWQFCYDMPRSDFFFFVFFLLGAWGAVLNLCPDVFIEFGEILSHYFSKYCFCTFLSLLRFQLLEC